MWDPFSCLISQNNGLKEREGGVRWERELAEKLVKIYTPKRYYTESLKLNIEYYKHIKIQDNQRLF